MKQRFLILGLGSAISILMIGLYYIHPPVLLRQIILLCLYIILLLGLVWRHRHLNVSLPRTLAALMLGFAWLYSSHTNSIRHQSMSQLIVTILAGAGLSFTFYFIIEELRKPFSKPIQKVSAKWMLLYAGIPLVCWLPYFLAYYPAKMNADSFWQWAMAHQVTPYNDWHPILHTWIIQATTLIHNTPATYIVLQMLFMALVVAYALYSFQKLGMPVWLVGFIDLFYAINPVNGFFSIAMWKDIPFAASILLFTILLIKSFWDPNWLKKKSHAIAFVGVSFIAMNLRSNGLEAIFIALILVIVLLKESRRRLLLLMIPILILQFIFIGPIMGAFNVIKPPLNEALAIPSQQIAATYKYNGRFTPQLKAYFNQILPEARWKKDYIPYNVNPIKWDKAYNANVIYASFPRYLSNWAKLLVLNPTTFVKAYMNQVAVIWQFSTPKGEQPYLVTPNSPSKYTLGVQIRAPKGTSALPASKMIKASYLSYVKTLHSYGKKAPSFAVFKKRINQTVDPLKAKPKSHKLRTMLDKLYNHTRYNWMNYFTKGAIPLFLLLAGLIASISRFRWRGISVFLPAVFVILTMAMAMPATDFRYSYGFVFSVPFLLLFSKLKNEHLEEQPEE